MRNPIKPKINSCWVLVVLMISWRKIATTMVAGWMTAWRRKDQAGLTNAAEDGRKVKDIGEPRRPNNCGN